MNRTLHILSKLVFCLLVGYLLSSCSSVSHLTEMARAEVSVHSDSFKILIPRKKDSRVLLFEAGTTGYAKNVRYGYFQEALKSVRKRSGNPSDLSLERMNSYRVHTYEVLSSLLVDNGREGLVTVKIDYYSIDTGIIKTVIDRQKWWFGDTTQTWYLEHFFLAD
ncbi:MAG: hypothetical protein HOK64_07320 [Proteobacteria bacterium]|nr:hypothetical protein [Pseudomonadota bacterium]MBT5064993.1 hypothetical protein [Pseudomonadota bacterium]MBT6192262.1 hypothetical protein [Pseudomonadota bacterium]MBT6465505.1 hypothetical protein [Pseudomonadota bacterium]MBT6674950.1 hypothetical protein [Pseudomonadota bacterium]